MIRTLRAGWIGLAAAWETAEWIEADDGLQELAEGVPGEKDPYGPAGALAGRAERAAELGLRVLARLPDSRWRATCLYRSVATCLVRRRLGLPARLALGVRSDGPGEGGPSAHAWSEGADEDPGPEGEGWSRLTRPGGR